MLMAPQKSPAFQFYPKDFLSGTATMSLQEVGAYMRLLCYAWDTGSIPNDSRERARIMVCSKKQEVEIWKKVGKKFFLQDDAFLNERLEEERRKQSEYRRRQSDKGKASGVARSQPNGNHGSTTVQPRFNHGSVPVDVRLEPEGNSSSSSSSSKDLNTQTPPVRANGHGRGANAPNALPRDHRFHAVCSPKWRVCLTEATAAKLAAIWGGDPNDTTQALERFVTVLEAQIGDGPKGDFLWLTQHFEAFMHAEGRVPVAAPKPAKVNGQSINDQIDEWAKS
jgi:uncharacterized protein YdaU (DUF1376 family)